MFISNEHFAIEENSGEITAKEEYNGTNILFELDVDKSKANPEKASNYLIELNEEWTEETGNIDDNNVESNAESSEKPTLTSTEE